MNNWLNPKEVSKRIGIAIKAKGYSQYDVTFYAKPYCKEIDTALAKSTLSQYMLGSQIPDPERLYVLSEVLDVNPAWLLGFDVPMSAKTKEEDIELLKSISSLSRRDKNIIKAVIREMSKY